MLIVNGIRARTDFTAVITNTTKRLRCSVVCWIEHFSTSDTCLLAETMNFTMFWGKKSYL